MNRPSVSTGTTYLLGAQGVFLLSSYGMHIVLGRYLGPVEYGIFGVVLYAATIVRTFVATSLPMAVSRYVSAEPENAEAIFRKGLKLQFFLSLCLSLAFFAAAPWIARLLGDEGLTSLLRIVAAITVFFSVFFLVIQYYNGLRQYGTQSLWLTVSYLLRAGITIVLAVIGLRVLGAIVGLVAAVGISCILILITRKPGKLSAPFSSATLISFSIPLILSSVGHALLVDLDLMFVKKLVTDQASTGYYTSAKAMAHAVPFAFYALSGALYPAVSNAYSSGDMKSLKGYIRKANRLLLLVALPAFVLIGLNSAEILSLLYGQQYINGAAALRWLMLAFCMLAIFMIHKTIITGCGFPKISSALTLLLLPLSIALMTILIPIFGLEGAAISSTVTFAVGMVLSTIIIFVKFGVGFEIHSTMRIFAAAAVLLMVDSLLTKIAMPIVPRLLVAGLTYLIVLRIFGEFYLKSLQEAIAQIAGSWKRRG